MNSSTASFLWLSDIHLDPFYGTEYAVESAYAKHTHSCTIDSTVKNYPLGRNGCDAPAQLVDSALDYAYSIAKKIDEHARHDGDALFMIITGDICRHGTDQLEDPMHEIEHILKEISGQLSKNMIVDRDISVIPSIGNNDVTPDYFLNTTSYEDGTSNSMLETIADGLSPLFHNTHEEETFRKGGYLARTIGDKLTILSLNTIVYSTRHTDADGNKNDDDHPDPFGQFQWIEEQLRIASDSSRYVYIISHIPPTIGSYRHTQLWKDQYLVKYYKIYNSFKQVIKGQFFGHLHTDEFRIPDVEAFLPLSSNMPEDSGKDNTDDGPILWIASSITPVYGSNPSIRQVFYEFETGQVLDYDTYYLNLTDPQIEIDWEQNNEQGRDVKNWVKHPQSFKESFGLQDLSRGSLKRWVVNELELNAQSPYWNTLIERQHIYQTYDMDDTEDPKETRQLEWICTFSSVTAEQYRKCLALKNGESKDSFLVLMIVILIAAVAISVLISWSCLKSWKRRRYRRTDNLEQDNRQQRTNSTIEIPEIT